MGVKVMVCEYCGGTYTSWESCDCQRIAPPVTTPAETSAEKADAQLCESCAP